MANGCKKELKGCSTRAGKFGSIIYAAGALFLLTRVGSMISYPNYKFIFPIKALGMYSRRFEATYTNGHV